MLKAIILAFTLLSSTAFSQVHTLRDEIQLSDIKRTVKVLTESSFKLIGLGFKKNQILDKHTTPTPAVLIVQSGSIDFKMKGKTYTLKAGDFFNIPANIEHELIGREDSLLYLVK